MPNRLRSLWTTLERDLVERATWGAALLLTAVAIAVALLGRPMIGLFIILGTIVAMLFVLTDRDPTVILTLFVVSLLLIPSRYVVGPLGAIGTPAKLIGLAALVWWLGSRLNPVLGADHGEQPLRPVLLSFLWWLMLSYAFGYLRPLTPAEISSTDRTMLTMVTLTGIALLAMDGISNRERLERLLQRLVALAAVVGLVGILQFFGTDLVTMVRLPGLTLNSELQTVYGFRGDLPRITGTAAHPIEFGVVLALIVPFALHFAFYRRERRWLSRVWLVIILLALPTAVGRSPILALAVAVTVLALRWTWLQRISLVAILVVLTISVNAVVPTLLTTLSQLFTQWDADVSIQSRAEDYPLIWEYVTASPWVGRGTGTFEPTQYFFLDNQWLKTAVTAGIPGVLLLILVFLVTMGCARGIVRRSPDAETAHLAQAFLATMATFAVILGTFDAFAFNISAGLFFLVVGALGAFWRLQVGSTASGRDERGWLVVPRREPARKAAGALPPI